MRIVHESPDLLVVAEPAVGMRTIGGVIAALGVVMLGLAMRTGEPPILPGAVTLAVGALFIALPAIRTFYFNRGEQQLVVSRRRLWSRRDAGPHDVYPLRDVVAAQLDASSSDDGGSTYRLIVRLTDGRVIPFTTYYTSSYASKLEMANRISSFLGTPQGTRSVGGLPSPHTIATTSRRTAVVIALVFVAFGIVFGSIGAVAMVREYHRLTEWQSVQATVVSTRVDVHSDSDGNTYLPVIVYRYSVDDRAYTSSRAFPLSESRGGSWAYRVIARFNIGGQYTAWYDPANPANAFIIRSHSIIAPVFTLIGVLAVVGGCAGAISARREG
jgi:hypothetical protein